MHPADLQAAVTNARDFEAAKLKANHAQTINLVMNGSSNLDSKLKQLSDSLNQKLEGSILTKLPTDNAVIVSNPNDTAIILISSLLVSSINLLTTVPTHLSAAASDNLSAPTKLNTTPVLISKQNPKAKTNTTKLEIVNGSLSTDLQYTQNPNSQFYLSLLVTPEDAQPNNLKTNQQPTLISNILPTTITENKLLDVIFPFKLEELSATSLFKGAALEEKLIMAMYTNAKVNGHLIKLILNNGLAGSIITRQLMDQLGHRVDQAASAKIIIANGATKTPIGKIDDLPIEINGIIVLIKVLVMEATQYQALIGNDWLIETYRSFNLAKMVDTPAYQSHVVISRLPTHQHLLSTDENHNELSLVLSWGNNRKEKKRKEPIWNSNQEEKTKEKEKGKEEKSIFTSTITYNFYTIPQQSAYYCPKLASTVVMMRNTRQQPSSTDNEPCLACGETLLDKGMWNDIPGRRGTYNELCQYTILINTVWRHAVKQLDELLPKEIKTIKNNPPELIELDWDPEPELAPTKEEQEQWLEEINI
ncbi:hypothetical protein G9A89_018396 [Geosiphon pyriformis]|nr:hypothetical protein G9A89_018396 [Geosiphon pyriformis]